MLTRRIEHKQAGLITTVKEEDMNEKDIARLVENQSDHYSIAQAFYRDPTIYERDVERVFMNSWLYAGHQSEIPKVGDWFLFELTGGISDYCTQQRK